LAASPRRDEAYHPVELSELSQALANLDPLHASTLGERIVALIAEFLHTDRVSLILLNRRQSSPPKAFSAGVKLTSRELNRSTKIMDKVRKEKRPLLMYDIRQHSELLSPWADDYLTDAFAVYPLRRGQRVIALLCISNLSAQQLMFLENASSQLELIIAQMLQLSVLLLKEPSAPDRIGPANRDEIALLNALIEKLDQSMDTRNVFTIFNEMIRDYIPIEVLVVIHDKMHDAQQGVICVSRPVHQSELHSLFDTLANQWRRRHKRNPLLNAKEARILGEELVSCEGECPSELMLGRNEVFPIFIDNDLFALVSLTAEEDILKDRRRLRLFNILVHHLFLHVKKGLLMVQNQEMQTVDALTGLYNERHFYQMMEREFDRAARYNVPLSLLFMDVDHFKDVNETYGYEAGAMLLQEISRILMENIRSTDFVSRYGGERFVLVLPETHYKNAEIMANRLRRYIENNSFVISNTNVFIKVTVSLGVASYLDHKPASLAQFIEFADTALYFAKRGGRNQVVGYSYVINMMMRETDHES